MYPFLFEIGSFRLPTFGLMVALGFLAALWVLQKELPRRGFDEELGSSIITAGMLGATSMMVGTGTTGAWLGMARKPWAGVFAWAAAPA